MPSPKLPPSPACGVSGSVISHGKRHAFYPLGCLFVLGPFIALFHQATAPIDYECHACARKFSRRTALAWFCVALVPLAIFLRIVLAVIDTYLP